MAANCIHDRCDCCPGEALLLLPALTVKVEELLVAVVKDQVADLAIGSPAVFLAPLTVAV